MSWWKTEARAQFRLASSIVVIQVGLMAMGVVDSAYMGRVSSVEYAGVTLGNTWTAFFLMMGMGVLTSLDPVISQAWGAKDSRAISRGLQRGLLLAVLLSIAIALAILPVRGALTWMNQPADVVPIAANYALISILAVPPFLLFVALRQSLQAMHTLRPLMVIILLGNLLNAFLDWVLIFGNLGAPAMGAEGSAWTSVASRWFMAFGLLLFSWPLLKDYLKFSPEIFAWRPMARMLKVGIPVGIQFGVEGGAFCVVAFLMGSLGAKELAGHAVAIHLASTSFMVPLGISMAVSVRVGNAIGRADEEAVRHAATVGLVAGAGTMLGFGVLFLCLPLPLARIFTNLEDVLAIAVALIPLAGFFQVFDGTQVVAAGVLRGMADTRVPMLIHFAGFWFAGMPLGYYLAFPAEHGPRGLWWGLVAGLFAVAVVQFARVQQLLKRGVKRLIIDEEQRDRSSAMNNEHS